MKNLFDVALIEERLNAELSDLIEIGSVSDYSRFNDIGSFTTPSAYVLLVKEEVVPGDLSVTAKVKVKFKVIIATNNDKNSSSYSEDKAEKIVGKIRESLIGFRPGERSQGVSCCCWESGGLVDYDRNVLLWSDVYIVNKFMNQAFENV